MFNCNSVRDNLTKIFGDLVTVCSNSDRVIYVPTDVVTKLEEMGKLNEVGLVNEEKEDTTFNNLRLQSKEMALRAFRI